MWRRNVRGPAPEADGNIQYLRPNFFVIRYERSSGGMVGKQALGVGERRRTMHLTEAARSCIPSGSIGSHGLYTPLDTLTKPLLWFVDSMSLGCWLRTLGQQYLTCLLTRPLRRGKIIWAQLSLPQGVLEWGESLPCCELNASLAG
jgi:hypothetical protein